MMTREEAANATLDQLTDELAAAGWDSTQQTRSEALEAVLALISENNWKNNAHAINGTENSHYDLARYCELKGFEVEGDTDDMQKSFIARPGSECFGDRIIGEINGDAEAKVTITADLS